MFPDSISLPSNSHELLPLLFAIKYKQTHTYCCWWATPGWRRWLPSHTLIHNTHVHIHPLVRGQSFPMGNTLISMQPCWPSSCDLFPSILAPQTRPCVCVSERERERESVSPRGGCEASSFTWYSFRMLNWMCLCRSESACNVSLWLPALVKIYMI